ncbi:MAG: DUF1848 domain-containing protein [Anaerolineales bacterium]|nr:DUF1848 domain-containing protein [Anaerolineales bacterium]
MMCYTCRMIISASRRTDIPAFYCEWFMNRIRAGFCTVPNPFNTKQISHISLLPRDVNAIVFWTRDPRPLIPYLPELDRLGHRYYFQFTLLGYPRLLEPHAPSLDAAVAAFKTLSGLVGPDRVIWRYDPILLSSITGAAYHIQAFRQIAALLKSSTRRVVISLFDPYHHAIKRLESLKTEGLDMTIAEQIDRQLGVLVPALVDTAADIGLEIASCADTYGLSRFGVPPGKCIDDTLIQRLFGIQVPSNKDPGQRKACHCAPSKDIGVYNTCIFGCLYCYAAQSFERAKENFKAHNPRAEELRW